MPCSADAGHLRDRTSVADELGRSSFPRTWLGDGGDPSRVSTMERTDGQSELVAFLLI